MYVHTVVIATLGWALTILYLTENLLMLHAYDKKIYCQMDPR